MARVSNKYGKSIVFAIVLLLASSLLHAKTKAGDWELVKEDEGHDIVVYYRNLKSGNVEFRGITHLRTSLSSFIALLKDFETLPEWAYRTDKVVTLKQNSNTESNTEAYVYTIHPMPWPFMPRDSVLLSHIDQNPQTFAVIVKGRAVPDYIPLNDDYVRISSGESFWQLTPIEEGTLEVVFQGYGEPGGSFSGYGEPGGSFSESVFTSTIFRSLVKLYLWKLPYKTLKRIQHHILNEKYQKKRFNFIKEPPSGKIKHLFSQDLVNNEASL
jgi:hypothetical protein